MILGRGGDRPVFHFVMIKPSHYDDDGYVIQWMRSALPSNTLAAVYGLAADCAERRVLGADVDIGLCAYDETNARIRPPAIARWIARHADRGQCEKCALHVSVV